MTANKKTSTIIFFGIILIALISVSIFIKPNFKHKQKNVTPRKAVPYNDYSYIIPDELNKKIAKKESLTLLDIRDTDNFQKIHIENSINIPYKDLSDNLDRLPKNKPLIIIGYDYMDKAQVTKVMDILKNAGFTDIVALSGGFSEWKKENNPTISSGDPESGIDVSKVEYILPEQLELAIDNKYPLFILDVRPNILFRQGHIPGAKNIPLINLEQHKNDISFTKEIVVYGRSQLEDFKAGVKLYDLGFLANYIIKGGFSAWQDKGFDVEK